MSNKNLVQMEWETLLVPETLSADELESHEAIVSDYRNNMYSDETINLAAIDQKIEIEITDALLASEEIVIDKISNNDLFEYLKEENVTTDLNVRFPKIKRINQLFWFLHNLAKLDISNSKITLVNSDKLSTGFYQIIEAGMFFDYIKRLKADGEFYFVPTENYEVFINEPTEEQYALFLASLGRNETVSEALNIQLNDPIYDNISRQMVFNLLVKDPNIQKEKLSKDEMNVILSHLRYWYLNIKQMILDN